jgi:hypothetical protein
MPDIPSPVKVELYNYQRDAVNRLRSGCILCADVGIGKSITALAYFLQKECGGSLYIEQNLNSKSLRKIDLYIITTAKKRDDRDWHKEAERFAIFEDGSGLGIKLTVDSWNNISKYANVKGAFFIFDEQRLVGYGKWVKSFLKIAKVNRWILLTATPGDTWLEYCPVFIANGFYTSRKDFTDHHAIWKQYSKFPQVQGYYNEGILIRHRNAIVVHMVKTKETVPHHETIYLPYDVKKSRDAMRNRWNPYLNKPIDDAGELCRVLRRISNEDPSRYEQVKMLIEANPKVIIFYNFDYELEILRKLPTVIAEWNGHRHEDLPTGSKWAYLVQYNAGAEGWNCITTDTIIFYSQSYSYKLMTQAAGRIDRINTPFTDLHYFHLSSRSKIDMAIARALSKKRNFNEKDFAGF